MKYLHILHVYLVSLRWRFAINNVGQSANNRNKNLHYVFIAQVSVKIYFEIFVRHFLVGKITWHCRLGLTIMGFFGFCKPTIAFISKHTITLISLPAATKLGQGNIFRSVCLSTGGRGVCLSACWDAPPGADSPPLGSKHPPEADTPPGADTRLPGSRHPPGPGRRPRKQTAAYG